MSACTPEKIDALLPQTQCGLCGYGGCMPYAKAIMMNKAPINLCPPGGTETLFALANLLNKDPSPYIGEMEKKAKPPSLAYIREAECIGCAKCIQACPIDAIIGSAKQMHTVLTDICTGCELCVAPCPVDCIDMIQTNATIPSMDPHKTSLLREKYYAKQRRIDNKNSYSDVPLLETATQSIESKKDFIQQAILLAKNKKKNL